jgi:hypothetical protein
MPRRSVKPARREEEEEQKGEAADELEARG